jgi:acetyltransferase-like isoleucine patch superfamily enzyme
MSATTIVAAERIVIGEGVVISPNVTITDSDWKNSQFSAISDRAESAAVSIGRGVFIGIGAVILKGVSIGEDAVVGAGSVVTRDVAPGAVVGGNPAAPLRRA